MTITQSSLRLDKLIKEITVDRSLLLASNRGPIQYYRDASGEIKGKRGAGGLTTALRSVLKTTGAIWFASSLSEEDRAVAEDNPLIGVPEENPEYYLKLLPIEKETFNRYYNDISNDILWFLQHYLFDPVYSPVFDKKFKDSWNLGYKVVNELYSSAMLDACIDEDDPLILLQDYHLYMVAMNIRARKPNAKIFHFIHIPWCAPDYMRLIPDYVRSDILSSLLCCDIVGLHNARYVDNLIRCFDEFLDVRVDYDSKQVFTGERVVRVRSYPISVDVEDLLEFSKSDPVKVAEEKFLLKKGDLKAIVRVDRAELSKNIIRGFNAYALLLEVNPEWLEKVKFFAYTYPSRTDISAYKKYTDEIKKTVAIINSRFGTDGWQPIELEMTDDFPRSVASMKHFDVMLTNPIFDGMNLVAKEAALLNEKNGVIILSENAGAIDELGVGVVPVNPFDIDSTATALHESLGLDVLKRAMMSKKLKEVIHEKDMSKWLLDQFNDIKEIL